MLKRWGKNKISTHRRPSIILIQFSKVCSALKNVVNPGWFLYVPLYDSNLDFVGIVAPGLIASVKKFTRNYGYPHFGYKYLWLYLVLTVFMRLVCHYELKIDQKKIYCVRYETGFIADVARFVKDKQNIYMFLGEFCILILHPTILFKGIKVTFF